MPSAKMATILSRGVGVGSDKFVAVALNGDPHGSDKLEQAKCLKTCRAESIYRNSTYYVYNGTVYLLVQCCFLLSK